MVALSMAGPAAAESWRAFPTAATNALFSVDEESLVREGDKVTFWERLVFVTPFQRDEGSGKKVKEKRVHRVMNCADKTQGHLYGSLLAEDGALIEAIAIDAADIKMTPVPADTLAEQELTWACAAK
ncbi:MAG: hypothetical protein H0U63_07215 [Burkholderiales bacterium]|nr:hypothetical protein [Burkholderiales bacterium]